PAPAAAAASVAAAAAAPPPAPRRETLFVYRFAHNLVSYLVSLIVGKFDVDESDWKGIPLRAYVPPGRRTAARLAFGLTPRMMEFFSEYTGCAYPYPSYAQTTVWDFSYGGMENSSVTTLNLRALHSPRAHLDYQADNLVAHELVHQWFGDLLTCKDWQEMWLNEGFATYFAALWTERDRGAEEFAIDRLQTVRSVAHATTPELLANLKREAGKEKKPLDLPAGMNYTKGSVVLHTLRGVLGDDRFREGIRHYVAKHRDACVTSEDFRKAMEESSGEDLKWFFDQWVYGAGVPDLVVEYEWHVEPKSAVIRVRQTQPESLGRGVYRLPVTLGFGYAEGERGARVEARPVLVDAREKEFEVVLPREPDFVRFDVGGRVPKRLDFELPLPMLAAQLTRDPDVTGRYEAAERLGREGKEGRRLLEKALKDEPFYGVRARIVDSLVEADAEGALTALLEAMRDPRAEVRRAAARGLGKQPADKVEAALVEAFERDGSDEVVEEAMRSLGACRAPSAPEVLRRALRRPSYREAIRSGAIEGLARSGDVKAIPELLAFVTRPWEAGAMHRVTRIAMEQLAQLAPQDPRVVEAVLKALSDPYFRTRSAAAGALAQMKPAKAAAALLDRAKVETEPGVKDAIEAALRKLWGESVVRADEDRAQGKSADELDAEATALENEAASMSVETEVKRLEAKKLRLRAEALRAKGGKGKPKETEKK
ncbi:MAG: HEAT repeat domain-containing protein, partial [Planctomycetes bacterium]|nr:HEAT repeat domain-containing protein [Planctomycetota bacterium]